MKYSDKIPTYSKCPEHVQRRIERFFARALELYPYPEGIRERILWVHLMIDALRGLEADSINLRSCPISRIAALLFGWYAECG